MRPTDLLLRCYAQQQASGRWYAVCVDLNLDAEAPSLPEAKRSLENAILGYLETVLDTSAAESIPHLLHRPAPWKGRATYALIRTLALVRLQWRKAIAFLEPVPVQLAPQGA
jgi:hypothetical protein